MIAGICYLFLDQLTAQFQNSEYWTDEVYDYNENSDFHDNNFQVQKQPLYGDEEINRWKRLKKKSGQETII